jgi:DNA-directed RNA polymerase II subunit RPB2
MDNSTIWKIIDRYFQDNPQCLVRHHIESYEDFFKTGIHQIFKEKNPVRISSNYDESIGEFRNECLLYFGGRNGDRIYIGKPVIYDKDNEHYMFPNEARLRNMTYGMTIHYDIEIEYVTILKPGEIPDLVGMNKLEKITEEDLDNHDSDNEIVNKHQYKSKTDIANEEKIEDVIDTEMKKGGAPTTVKATYKTANKRKTKNRKMTLTPAETAIIRKATEDSVRGNRQIREEVLEGIYLGKFPIMVQSEFCVLKGLPREMKYNMGECKNDIGGYFIIDGKEKTIIPQETFANNMIDIRKSKDDKYLYTADIRSVSENVSKPVRTLSVKIVAPSNKYTFENIVVNIPNVRKPIPLFIVFRALGIISDKAIITTCLLDLEKYRPMLNLFVPSAQDAGSIMTQLTALKFIATFTKGKTVAHAHEILTDYFLPHIGETNYITKAYFLGYMVFRLLCVYNGTENPTNRDNYKYKRVETVGTLIRDLFAEYYSIQLKTIQVSFEKILYFNKTIYADNLDELINKNYKEIFQEREVDAGFRKAFKGNWGAKAHTKRIGIVQDLNRLSFNSAINHLRKTTLPMENGLKLVEPRLLHSTQWGMYDPIDTPDGSDIGLHKHLSMMAHITKGISREPMIDWLFENAAMKRVEECTPILLSTMTKVFVNGYWAGAINEPIATLEKIRLFRRNALISIYTSVAFDYMMNAIMIYTDGGRLCRPLFYRDYHTQKMSFELPDIAKRLDNDEFTWIELISGFNEKRAELKFHPNEMKTYSLKELYSSVESDTDMSKNKRFIEKKAVLDYLDTNETETALIALNQETYDTGVHRDKYTHMEIHESLVLSVMINMAIFPENNPATRNNFSCGQSKQSVSLYHTNYQMRMDKTAVVLSYGQKPAVKSRYLEYINHEENPYGENLIVAIMCYTGYNVEDAILMNEGSIHRGMFRTTYFSTYESHEEHTITNDMTVETIFTNIETEEGTVGMKPGYDYSKLDKYGLILENTPINEKTVLIGAITRTSRVESRKTDCSKTPKKGQLGVVDKSFITEGEEGKRIAKIRIREERLPCIGDKMASRAGQKGTVGLIIPERDMPFLKSGLRPDIIINPHAIPSRMTIGQLVETITGKASVYYGSFGDTTAYNNRGSKIGIYGEMLTKAGFHSSGNDILYNGMTGEQIESEIFIGVNYYMRLKHMVKDKINFRALGPRTALTKQPVSGRANDGGLRIGEMERDGVASHGMTNFLTESMMERGDKYYMAICNKTGMLAVYNPAKNLFMSPMADGPLRFTGELDDGKMNLQYITRFGRSFSVVSVPYSLKLLIQELQTMNVQMRIITEDNIKQLESMSFSKNINYLLNERTDITPEKIIQKLRNAISTELANSKKSDKTNGKFGGKEEDNADVYIYEKRPELNTNPREIEELRDDFESYNNSPKFNPGSPLEEKSNNENGDEFNSPSYPEDNSPTYPEETDEPPNTMNQNDRIVKGGKSYHRNAADDDADDDNLNKYKINDIVLLRGHVPPNEKWILKKMGVNVVTLHKLHPDKNDSTEDIVHVAAISDIMPYDPIYDKYPQTNPYDSMKMMTGHSNELDPNIMPTMPPNVTVNPVIKIFNGNGNDMSSGSGTGDETANNGQSSPYIVETGSDKSKKVKGGTNDETNVNNEKEESSGGGSFGSGIIDFAKNLFIKKIP